MAITIRDDLVKAVIRELHDMFGKYNMTVGEVLMVCMCFIAMILEEYPPERRKRLLEHIKLTIGDYLRASG